MLWLCWSLFAQAQNVTLTEELAPNANLEAFGIPRVPAALVRQIKSYSGAYGLPHAGWDGEKRSVLLKGLSSVAWVSRVVEPNVSPQSWLYLQEEGIYDFYFQPKGSFLLYNRDVNGNEAFQMYCYDIQRNSSVLITDGKSRSTEPVWSRQGTQVVYSSSPPGKNGVNLNLVNPFDPTSNHVLVASSGAYLRAYDWSPNDVDVVFCEFASNTHSKLWLVNSVSSKTTLLSPKNEDSYYSAPQFSHDGKGLYVITDHGSDLRRLAYLDLASKKFTYLTNKMKGDVEEFRLSPDGKHLAVIVNEGGISKLYGINATSLHTQAFDSIPPNGVISDLRWHQNSNDLVFNFKSADVPNDVYSVEVSVGKVTQWSHSAKAIAPKENLPAFQAIAWKSFDGKNIKGFIARPPKSFRGKRPVVIELHGGPSEQYRPTLSAEDNFLRNELGLTKIYPNVRGSSGHGKTFLSLDDGMKRMDAIKDVGALLDWIKTQPDLDSDRVLVQGASYGGYLALSTASQYSSRLRGVISDAGMTNLVPFLKQTEGWRREIQRAEFGDDRDDKMKSYLDSISPLRSAAKIACPVFLIQGKNDPRVPVSEAESFVSLRKQFKQPIWYLLGKNEGHGFADAANYEYQVGASILFMKEYLLR